MFFIVNDPGPWQFYVKRADNIGLPIMEVKQKYLKEQALFEAEQRRQYNEYMRMIHDGRGGPGGSSGAGFSGQGIDGPIAGATVLAVAEGVTTTTDANGFFTFNFIPSGDIELSGGTDTVTGVEFLGTLKAPKGSTVISPITTAIKEIMDLGNTEEEATDAVFNYAREIYEIDIPSNIRERVKKENFLTLAETNNDFLKVVGFTSILEASAEVASGGVGTITGASMKVHKEAFYKRTASIINSNKTRLRSGSGNNWQGNPVYNRDNFKKLSMQLSGDNVTTISSGNANSLKIALDHTLDRIKEVVNDANMDPSFGTTAVMTQNRLAKREMAVAAAHFGKGNMDGSALSTNAKASVDKEVDEYSNLGTIFEGKQNQEEPATEKQENLFPAVLDYVTVTKEGQKYAQGELTRSLTNKVNSQPTYGGTINGEATHLWYDRASKKWVLDNNLTAPYIGTANRKQSYPVTGNYTKSGATIIVALPDVYQDQPSVGQGGRSTIDSLSLKGAFRWDEASEGKTNRETGVTTWTVSGRIFPASIDGRATITTSFKGQFTITHNFGSQLYVITLGPAGADLVDGLSITSLRFFNMGVGLSDIRQQINQTRAFTPTFVAASFT